jgi:ABC-type amino acid transport substrate-binding protein
MKLYLLLLSFLVIAFFTFRIRQARTAPMSPTLTIGIMTPYFPYATLSDSGELEGFDIAVAQELSKRLNRSLVFEDMPLASLLLALKQNKVDLVLSGLSITAEREQALNMIYYYGEPVCTFPLLFWQQKPAEIETLADLAIQPDTVVCVEPGSAQEKFIKTTYPELSLSYVPAIADIVMALKYGKAKAALIDPEILPALLKKAPELVTLDVELPPAFQSRGVGIGINKTNQQLTQEIEHCIKQMQEDGTLQRLAAEWFKE